MGNHVARPADPRLAADMLERGLLVEPLRLALDYGDGPSGTVAQARAKPIAVAILNEPGFAINDLDRALLTGRDAQTTTITLLLVNLNDAANGRRGHALTLPVRWKRQARHGGCVQKGLFGRWRGRPMPGLGEAEGRRGRPGEPVTCGLALRKCEPDGFRNTGPGSVAARLRRTAPIARPLLWVIVLW